MQLAKGLSSTNAGMREQTLKAMLPLAPKLSARTLSSTLLKQLDKLQVRLRYYPHPFSPICSHPYSSLACLWSPTMGEVGSGSSWLQ